jgi:hypothetical protein
VTPLGNGTLPAALTTRVELARRAVKVVLGLREREW